MGKTFKDISRSTTRQYMKNLRQALPGSYLRSEEHWMRASQEDRQRIQRVERERRAN